MLRRLLNSKIRDIAISATHLDYEGSITLDLDYIEAAGLAPNEEVDVLNGSNGVRFRTYVIEGARGSHVVELNGPAARLGMVGDPIMVLSYAYLTEDEIAHHVPRIVSFKDL
ncbi:MAG: aspartate 1-decarboxylase [Chitinivibrionales bacterium]|nr:aspartate 1-decarboxylase [Chitinivibrionales bacterium]